jgi:DNA-binding response OmpR family regulator
MMATVLVVDDDPDMRELESMALSYDGFEVLTAADGLEALNLLSTEHPCVIVLDLMMPGMDGLTFLVERKKRALGERIPVVCVSAAGRDMLSIAEALGARDCVPKPVELDALVACVRSHCERKSPSDRKGSAPGPA